MARTLLTDLELMVGGYALSRHFGEWVLDRLIKARYDAIAAGPDTLTMAWARYLRFLPAVSRAQVRKIDVETRQ